jgi:hypothetical protein
MPPVPVDDLPLPCAFTLGDKRTMPRSNIRNREQIRRDKKRGMETSLTVLDNGDLTPVLREDQVQKCLEAQRMFLTQRRKDTKTNY